jgi:hypothetical protein
MIADEGTVPQSLIASTQSRSHIAIRCSCQADVRKSADNADWCLSSQAFDPS